MEEDYTLCVDLARLQGEHVQAGDNLVEDFEIADCGVVEAGSVEEEDFTRGECSYVESGFCGAWG